MYGHVADMYRHNETIKSGCNCSYITSKYKRTPRKHSALAAATTSAGTPAASGTTGA